MLPTVPGSKLGSNLYLLKLVFDSCFNSLFQRIYKRTKHINNNCSNSDRQLSVAAVPLVVAALVVACGRCHKMDSRKCRQVTTHFESIYSAKTTNRELEIGVAEWSATVLKFSSPPATGVQGAGGVAFPLAMPMPDINNNLWQTPDNQANK